MLSELGDEISEITSERRNIENIVYADKTRYGSYVDFCLSYIISGFTGMIGRNGTRISHLSPYLLIMQF